METAWTNSLAGKAMWVASAATTMMCLSPRVITPVRMASLKQSMTFAPLAHPNSADYNNLSNSSYDPVADNAIVGTAVESGPANSTNKTYSNPSTMSSLWYFQKMLSRGYHLGPVIDHDNHNTTFGKTTRSRTAVLAPSLNRTELVKAMREMRFYATE